MVKPSILIQSSSFPHFLCAEIRANKYPDLRRRFNNFIINISEYWAAEEVSIVRKPSHLSMCGSTQCVSIPNKYATWAELNCILVHFRKICYSAQSGLNSSWRFLSFCPKCSHWGLNHVIAVALNASGPDTYVWPWCRYITGSYRRYPPDHRNGSLFFRRRLPRYRTRNISRLPNLHNPHRPSVK